MSLSLLPTVTPPTLAIADSDARFPVRRVFCVGRNYWWQDARIERGEREPIFFFMKPADAVVPATGVIPYPPLTTDFCHEIELVVAIGTDGADISPQEAANHIWGYAAGLDLTRRELQMEAKKVGRPWEGAKAFDASAPCSPLVPAARCGHPSAGAVVLAVNGVERQRADLADLIWPIDEIISTISRSVTLKAGDLIFTGTPSGVDALQPGDIVAARIAGVNELRVTIGSRSAHAD